MSSTAEVLLAIAKELAVQAQSGFPKAENGDVIAKECFEDGVYVRETNSGSSVFIDRYDFRTKKFSRVAVTK